MSHGPIYPLGQLQKNNSIVNYYNNNPNNYSLCVLVLMYKHSVLTPMFVNRVLV